MSQPFNQELIFLKRIAHQAGAIMRQYFRKTYKVYTKPDQSKVTDVDLAISAMVQEEVGNYFPEIGLYSEESEDKTIIEGKSYFIIDELDGTSYFIDGIPGFSHQAALFDAQSGCLEVGLVYYPITDVLVYAVKGQGAFIEEKGFSRPIPRRTGPARLSRLFYAHPLRFRGSKYWDLFEQLGVGEQRVVMVTASRTLKFTLGVLDTMIFLKERIPPWDLSGEQVIIKELGLYHGYLGGGEVTFGEDPPENNPGYLICPESAKAYLQERVLSILQG